MTQEKKPARARVRVRSPEAFARSERARSPQVRLREEKKTERLNDRPVS
jgi:hypothetical protein